MKITVLQPSYPAAGTLDSATMCMTWMQAQLTQLQPGEQDLMLLPEYANTPGLGERDLLHTCAENQGAAFLQFVAASAERLKCLIAVGVVAHEDDSWFNRTVVFDSTGTLVHSYDKIHLPVTEERDLGLTAGSKHCVFQHGKLRIGFATCFDLSFPEHFVVLAEQEVDLILCPSYQRSASAERILTVSQVRAMDSGAYLIRSSYAMDDSTRGGHSLVAAPDGTLLANAKDQVGIITTEFDPALKFIKPASHGQPHVEHRASIESRRRPDTYRK